MTIEMFVSATLRGSAKGTGKVMYTLRTKKNGENYEKPPEIGKAESTANRLVLWSICRALERLPSNREIVIYTENSYIASVINQCWPERWARNGWKNSRGKEIKDAGSVEKDTGRGPGSRALHHRRGRQARVF